MKTTKRSDMKNQAPGHDPAHGPTRRDPEDRGVHPRNSRKVREKMMDKTLADSYPASDPPSTIPDPGEDDSMAA